VVVSGAVLVDVVLSELIYCPLVDHAVRRHRCSFEVREGRGQRAE
jgi:hypothetical protein